MIPAIAVQVEKKWIHELNNLSPRANQGSVIPPADKAGELVLFGHSEPCERIVDDAFD